MTEGETYCVCGGLIVDGVCNRLHLRVEGRGYMNQAQATDALTEAVCLGADQDLTCRGLYLGRRKLMRERARKALTAAMPHLPSIERIKQFGERKAKETLKASIMGDLISAGVIVLLFTIVPALAWSVLVSVIAGLLIHWILTNKTEAALIQQARAT